MTQQRLFELIHSENGTGNWMAIIHAEGVFIGLVVGSSDIIHAAGVRFGFPSSATRRARGGRLLGWCDVLKFLAEILEVVGADPQSLHFLNDRQKVCQRADGGQRLGIGLPHLAARRRQHECIFDNAHGNAPLEELGCQHSVRTANDPHRTRRFAIRFQDLMNVLLLTVIHDGASTLQFAQ
jgi:hypothetical protein